MNIELKNFNYSRTYSGILSINNIIFNIDISEL